jgi:hypothetical protein
MTRMTLRKISEMSKINKKALLDLDNILQNYKTAEDITLLDRIAKDLNIEEYIADHKAMYFNNVTQQCNHPVYIEECVLALNVFEGCCYADLSLKEKRIALVTALFRKTKKSAMVEKFRKHNTLTSSTQIEERDIFIAAVLNLHSKKAKPTKKDTVMRMVLWDARFMNLYSKDFNASDYLYELFNDLEVTEPSISFQMTKLLNSEYFTNWARLKAYKLNWPSVVKSIFNHMPEVKRVLVESRRLW